MAAYRRVYDLHHLQAHCQEPGSAPVIEYGLPLPFLHRQSKEASILWSHHEETRELPGERDNARNNVRCTQARKATHGLNGQHRDVDRAARGRVNQNDREQR